MLRLNPRGSESRALVFCDVVCCCCSPCTCECVASPLLVQPPACLNGNSFAPLEILEISPRSASRCNLYPHWLSVGAWSHHQVRVCACVCVCVCRARSPSVRGPRCRPSSRSARARPVPAVPPHKPAQGLVGGELQDRDDGEHLGYVPVPARPLCRDATAGTASGGGGGRSPADRPRGPGRGVRWLPFLVPPGCGVPAIRTTQSMCLVGEGGPLVRGAPAPSRSALRRPWDTLCAASWGIERTCNAPIRGPNLYSA